LDEILIYFQDTLSNLSFDNILDNGGAPDLPVDNSQVPSEVDNPPQPVPQPRGNPEVSPFIPPIAAPRRRINLLDPDQEQSPKRPPSVVQVEEENPVVQIDGGAALSASSSTSFASAAASPPNGAAPLRVTLTDEQLRDMGDLDLPPGTHYLPSSGKRMSLLS
jgi:hypothetical protein